MGKPVFADEPPIGRIKSVIISLICIVVSIGVLVIVLHVLESFKENAAVERRYIKTRR